ncbi:MAG: PAS domain S-box protein, partial [Polyangiales bacterium]
GSTVEVEVASSPILDEHGRVLGVAKIITDISHKKALERSLLALNATLEEQVRERSALLNAARRDLHNIRDALPVMIADWDREQRCRFANRAYAAWFGLEPQAVIGALLRDLFGPRYAVNLPFVERALRGESITLDREVPGPDGGPPRQVEIHYLPDSVDGDVPGFYLIAHNVTEQIETRARLAAALRETDALLSVIHQHAIVSMTDRAGKIIDVNDAFCRISGYSRDELMGADHRLINSHVHGSSFWRDMWRTIRASKPWRHVVCNRAKDGTLYWVDSIIAPLLSDNGAPTKFISIRFDITAAKRAELALRESERLQRGLLAHAGSAIIATDPHGTITLWNRAAQGLLGYEEHEVVATSTPTLFLAPDELASRRTQLEAAGISASSAFEVLVARARLERVDTSEWTYVRKDGSHVPVLLTVGSLRDESGEISGYLTTAVDLSARKQQEGELVELNRLLAERSRQAESANQAKSLFLANMSHEIRTPLNAVVGLTYLLEQGTLDPDQRDLVKKVKLASRSLLGVINDVLDLSKIEAGELEIEEAAFDLRSLLEELVSVMHVQASAKAIALTSYVDDAAPNVLHGDGLHLQQILTNLLSNAIKFTERGTVSLSVSALDLTDRTAKLVFTVKDSGIGIDPSVQERIFAPFTQADVSTTRRFGGTGLGLSIVKRLVTLMGGEVTMTSALGVGTEFAVSLPFLRDQRVPSGPARPLNVLVAGEEASACEQLSDLARALGWHAETVSTGDAALARLRARLVTDNPVELVIVPVRSVNPVIQQRLTELAHALPVQQRPALVVAVADRAVALEAATWTAESTAVVLSDGTSASALFNAVQEALAKRASAAGIDPKGVTGAETDVSSSSLAGKHVLVVDDSEINLMIATRILGLAGAQVTSAANGQEAVDLLRMRPRAFDAVLMDVQMPVLDGLEATRRIRRALGLTALPIIALTAGALVAERHRATAAGVDDFISKPFDPPTMIHKLVQRIAPASAGKAVTELRAHAPAQVPADWPVIESLDTGAAVASSGADRALLAQLLRTLFEQFSDLEQLTSVVDPSLMATRLHKLRGIAGTLGAAALTEAATRWELALRSQPSDPAEELGACVGRELARLRKSAERALPTSERPAATSRMRTAQSAAPAGDLSVLMALLERQSFKALEVFAALSPMLREQMTESELDGLRGAIDALEYHHALKTLERLFHKTETGWRRSTG